MHKTWGSSFNTSLGVLPKRDLLQGLYFHERKQFVIRSLTNVTQSLPNSLFILFFVCLLLLLCSFVLSFIRSFVCLFSLFLAEVFALPHKFLGRGIRRVFRSFYISEYEFFSFDNIWSNNKPTTGILSTRAAKECKGSLMSRFTKPNSFDVLIRV